MSSEYPYPAMYAEEAQEAARRLAHATRTLNDPNDSYQILGSLSAAMASIQQSLRQLASWHERRAGCATTDDRDRDAGELVAHQAAAWLGMAAARAEHVNAALECAHVCNARLDWQPEQSNRRGQLPPAIETQQQHNTSPSDTLTQ